MNCFTFCSVNWANQGQIDFKKSYNFQKRRASFPYIPTVPYGVRQRIYICKRTDSTPLRLSNICRISNFYYNTVFYIKKCYNIYFLRLFFYNGLFLYWTLF